MTSVLTYLTLDTFLGALEKSKKVYKIVVKVWNIVPPQLKSFILRRVNPSVTLGAVAVIADPYSSPADPLVLLGWHSYHIRARTPWALLGGALKKRDHDGSQTFQSGIPVAAVIREVHEETRLEIDVVKLLAIDTDWERRTMDFVFECALRKGYPDLKTPLPTPEVTKLGWFKLSELPDNMYPAHRRFLTDVFRPLPRVPGVTWTASQRPPEWWTRFVRAEQTRRQILNSSHEPRVVCGSLADSAREILNCELVSVFATRPPIPLVLPDCSIPNDIEGRLTLITESHQRRGLRINPPPLDLPMIAPTGGKMGLTAALVRARPIGRAIRLHEDWLHNHPHVRSWQDHDHLNDRTCHSLAAVAVVGRNKVLGIIKAENKIRTDASRFVPFDPDDAYILEEFAVAAVPALEELARSDASTEELLV